MAVRIQIMCINKTNRSIAHERIHSIGGKNPGGTRWKRSQEQAIADIETRTYEYYVTAGGRTAKVVLAKAPSATSTSRPWRTACSLTICSAWTNARRFSGPGDWSGVATGELRQLTVVTVR